MTFRNLRADEIECRPGKVWDDAISLLLYKDARVDQKILDETFGIYGWTRSHQLIGNSLYCTVSVKDPETGEWISKQDVGTESNMDKEKGLASDSFKRACFNWGIGRELYTAPFIKINKDKYRVDNKNRLIDRFYVSEIETENGRITYLKVVNSQGTVVFTSGVKESDQKATLKQRIPAERVTELRVMLKKRNVPEGEVLKRYSKKNAEELTLEDWTDICQNWNKLVADLGKTDEADR